MFILFWRPSFTLHEPCPSHFLLLTDYACTLVLHQIPTIRAQASEALCCQDTNMGTASTFTRVPHIFIPNFRQLLCRWDQRQGLNWDCSIVNYLDVLPIHRSSLQFTTCVFSPKNPVAKFDQTTKGVYCLQVEQWSQLRCHSCNLKRFGQNNWRYWSSQSSTVDHNREPQQSLRHHLVK